jgi:mRNA interferase HicA
VKLTAKYLIKIVERNGFTHKRSKGSHKIYYNQKTNKTIVIPVHGKEMPKGTFFAIIRQAGIVKNEI